MSFDFLILCPIINAIHSGKKLKIYNIWLKVFPPSFYYISKNAIGSIEHKQTSKHYTSLCEHKQEIQPSI